MIKFETFWKMFNLYNVVCLDLQIAFGRKQLRSENRHSPIRSTLFSKALFEWGLLLKLSLHVIEFFFSFFITDIILWIYNNINQLEILTLTFAHDRWFQRLCPKVSYESEYFHRNCPSRICSISKMNDRSTQWAFCVCSTHVNIYGEQLLLPSLPGHLARPCEHLLFLPSFAFLW